MVDSVSGTVLVVEDNDLNCKLFCDLLEAFGFEAISSRDGLDLMELLEKHQPDLVIMDIQLPDISGLDLTRIIKENEATRHIPVMAVTAFAMRQDEELVRQAGCEAYISKPIQIAPFIDMVKSLVQA